MQKITWAIANADVKSGKLYVCGSVERSRKDEEGKISNYAIEDWHKNEAGILLFWKSCDEDYASTNARRSSPSLCFGSDIWSARICVQVGWQEAIPRNYVAHDINSWGQQFASIVTPTQAALGCCCPKTQVTQPPPPPAALHFDCGASQSEEHFIPFACMRILGWPPTTNLIIYPATMMWTIGPQWSRVCLESRQMAMPAGDHKMSHEKNPPTLHYTGSFIGILIIVYYNPYITG